MTVDIIIVLVFESSMPQGSRYLLFSRFDVSMQSYLESNGDIDNNENNNRTESRFLQSPHCAAN